MGLKSKVTMSADGCRRAGLCEAIYGVPLEAGREGALQEDGGVSNLCQTEKRLPNVPPRSGIW